MVKWAPTGIMKEIKKEGYKVKDEGYKVEYNVDKILTFLGLELQRLM